MLQVPKGRKACMGPASVECQGPCVVCVELLHQAGGSVAGLPCQPAARPQARAVPGCCCSTLVFGVKQVMVNQCCSWQLCGCGVRLHIWSLE
jgi:hypothetical protein